MQSAFGIKKILMLSLFYLIILSGLNSEKWVGRAATYQLVEGEKTANGNIFEKDNLTAACNGFKFGAKVLVTNVKTGKQTTVLINDRINKESNYFMLLSPKAAENLDIKWETGLIVVDAKFSDVNSTERLSINGLIREGEIDLENLKRFPEINWPIIDEIEKEKDIAPLDFKEKKDDKTPVIEDKMDEDIDKKPLPKKEKTRDVYEKEQLIRPEIKDAKIEHDKDKKITWVKKLYSGKIYIRFSTTFDKNEGERRMMLFQKIFPNVIGLDKKGKYILFVGPVQKEKTDGILKSIRDFGFKDAYIVRGY